VAAGAGASLALACDLRVMAHDASLMMAFSNIGLVPDAGATWFLTRLIGYSRAYEMAVEGSRIPAERCYELGLTNKIVPSEQLMSIAMAWVRKLAERPTLALGLTKQAMQHAQLNDLSATIEYEAQLQKQTVGSIDFVEGVMAFIQKREPHFQGR
jgi:2-(1,2-epoxy-1,2-dihydrophenyl)acetyl-CoA isomerase